ncbi:MAG: cytochrome c3 family protein [Planctomycetota bacterium]
MWFWFSPKHTDVGYQPVQPILYSHQLHAGQLGIDCRYCHRMVDSGPHATVPDTETCMGCHRQVKKDSPLLPALLAAAETKRPIPWVKVHLLPDFAYFSHAVHVHAGVGCASCHGRIDGMEVVRQVQPLSMSWCLECHRNPAPHLRPAGVSPTLMDWQPDDRSLQAAGQRLASGEINPPTHCSACHR